MKISLKLCLLILFTLTIAITIVELIKTDLRFPFLNNNNNNNKNNHNRNNNQTNPEHNEEDKHDNKYQEILKTLDFKWGPTFQLQSKYIEQNDDSNNNSDDSTVSNDSGNEEKVKLIKICKNTVQGTKYIADDQGYVCLLGNVNPITGCCKVNNISKFDTITTTTTTTTSTSITTESSIIDDSNIDIDTLAAVEYERFSCNGCFKGYHCCRDYEFCVSCCMDSDKESILTRILVKLIEKGINPSFFKTQFDLCSFSCRTSSKSLVHQREYKQPLYKHCYGTKLPPNNHSPTTTTTSTTPTTTTAS